MVWAFRFKAAFIHIIPLLLVGCGPSHKPEPIFVLWAWERPEDLRFVARDAEVAVQTGFIEITGGDLTVRGRRFPLRVAEPPQTVVVHIQIDERSPLQWSPVLGRRVAAAVVHFATLYPAKTVQIDFEVRASQRSILLDTLRDVRAALGHRTRLSMTALASWCGDERWLDAAPVDEIVPMLFRMGRSGPSIRQRLASGKDFANPRCRSALAISTDEPIIRAPDARTVYLFDPHSWDASRFAAVRREVETW